MISGVQGQKTGSRKKHYSESFKIKVVKEVKKGLLTKEEARRKYGINGKSMVLYWCRQYGIEDYILNKKDRKKDYIADDKDKQIAELLWEKFMLFLIPYSLRSIKIK